MKQQTWAANRTSQRQLCLCTSQKLQTVGILGQQWQNPDRWLDAAVLLVVCKVRSASSFSFQTSPVAVAERCQSQVFQGKGKGSSGVWDSAIQTVPGL
eukprot:2159833-Amphidinium_carterae.1